MLHAGVRPPLSGAHWVDSVARHAQQSPSAAALRFGGETITWAGLWERVASMAAELEARGVGRGDRVVVRMANRPELIEAVLAANRLGAVAVPLNVRLAGPEVAFILDDCRPRMAVVDEAAREVMGARPDVPTLVVDHLAAQGRRPPLDDPVDLDEHLVALIMYTAGTTGRPKGVMLTHLNLLMQGITGIRTSRLFSDDHVGLINVPLFHIAGLVKLVPAFMLGLPTVLMPGGPFDAGETLDVVDRESVTELFLVPAQWQLLCGLPDAGRRGRSIRTMLWGAAPASRELQEQMLATFPHAALVSVFGQTEMTAVTTALTGDDARRRLGSVGRPVPLVAARVVDDASRDVPVGTVGEIVYRGPALMAGYWGQPDATAQALGDGWFHSGDLVRQDEDGFVYVVDRKKDMILSGGENVYCAEVEQALAGHPAVGDVAVIGRPHERWGEVPVAVVVPRDAARPPGLEELRTFARARLAGFKCPADLRVVTALPRNAAGKVDKQQLRRHDRHQDDRFDPPVEPRARETA